MKVLFLCASNVFRSQMAEEFFNKFSKKNIANSAGLEEKQDRMFKPVVVALKKEGIDISKNESKKISKDIVRDADLIIIMNRNLEKYFEPFKDYVNKNVTVEYWDIPDIHAMESDLNIYPEFVKAMEIIKEKVLDLVGNVENR